MIQALLGQEFHTLTQALTDQTGFSSEQADAFIPEAAKSFLGKYTKVRNFRCTVHCQSADCLT